MEIRFSKRFVKDLKHLNKKHPLVRRDVDELVTMFQRNEIPGDRLQGLGGQIIYKVRLNQRQKRGLSGHLLAENR